MQRRGLLVAAIAAALAMPASAADFPAKPMRIISAFGAGTATDTTARALAAAMTSLTGQPVIVENKPGAEGQIAAQAAAAAEPDGYTLFVTTQTTQCSNVHVYKTLAYDPVKSFAPISLLGRGSQIAIVRNDLPAQSIADLVALARAQPGKLTFGSGNGSSRGAAELFKLLAKVDLLSVPYKTQPQAVGDLLGGRIDVVFSDFYTGLPAALDGRARGLGVTSRQRIPGLTQFPAIAETVPGYEMFSWNAVYAPAGTPPAIVDRLNALVRSALATEIYLKVATTAHVAVAASSPEELAAFQAAETLKWGEIVAASGMKEP